MSDIDERVREAYRTLHVPDGLKAATLARIEEERRACASPAQRDVCPPESASSDASGNGGLAAQGAARRMSDAHGGRNASSHATGDKGFFAARRPRRAAGPRRRMMVAAAAACAILAAVGVGGYAYAMAPVAHVGIDVNPSFELSLNRFDRVVQARAVDEEAAEVLERIDIDGVRYEDAMETLASACRAYTGEEASVEVGVACDNEKRCEAIESAVLRCFEGDAGQVHCGRISDAQRQAAEEAGMGSGRYRLYETLVQAGVSVPIGEARTMPMAQLRALAEEAGVDTHDSACAGHGSMCSSEGWCDGHHQGEGAGQGQGHGQGQGAGQGRGQGQGPHRDA